MVSGGSVTGAGPTTDVVESMTLIKGTSINPTSEQQGHEAGGENTVFRLFYLMVRWYIRCILLINENPVFVQQCLILKTKAKGG